MVEKNTLFIMCLIFIIVLFIFKKILNGLENKLIFFPTKISEKKANKIIKNNLSITNHKIKTIDGEIIDVLYFENKNSNKLIIHAHGNAGTIYDRLDIFNRFENIASVIMFDYRGYGLSTGTPYEKGVYIDMLTIWNYCNNKLNYQANDITLHGCSLGCSIVLWLGKYLVNHDLNLPHGIIIESGFYNLADMISKLFSSYLIHLVDSQFNNIKYIKKIKNNIDILIIHSIDDEIINVNHAYKLKKYGKINSNNLMITTGSHNDTKIDKNIINKIKGFI